MKTYDPTVGFHNLLNLSHKLNRNWLFQGVGKILLIGLASRLLIFVSAIVGFYTFGIRPDTSGEGLWSSGVPVVNLFSRWDAGWYASIALNGYPSGGNPVSQAWAWFPLYPLAMKIVGSVFSGLLAPLDAVLVAGFLVSNALFFVSLFFFYKLSKAVLNNSRLALVSTVFFSFYPGALFYSCVYSESMFMALALGAFYFLEKGEGGKSTLLGFLAGLTRSNGFLVGIPFLFHGLQKRNLRLIFQSIVVASPYLWFNLFGYFSTGLFPIREICVTHYWGIPDFLFVQIFLMKYCGRNPLFVGYQILYFVGALLIIFPFIWMLFSKRWKIKSVSPYFGVESKDLKYWAFSLVTLATILFYSLEFSMQRYAIPILPMYWVSAIVWDRNARMGEVLFCIITTILVIGTVLFATWRFYY